MNLLLFLFVIGVSFITVRIGAIAFQLTGLPWPLATFQALSCFTGTGFTTRESELVTNNPQRRKIASVLIVLGHAGFVTLIATFANSLRTDLVTIYKVPFINSIIPGKLVPWINLVIIILGVYAIYRIVINSRLAVKLTDILRAHIIKNEIIKAVSFEELVVATGGYGVSRIEVCKDSPILNKSLREADLPRFNILLLAVERAGEVTPNPPIETKIILGDSLVCFGKLGDIRKNVCAQEGK
ncbi:MAG: TrkA C-terminal domain-containing protein [Candidatus Omnitrophica bacterium]|nr:TrkA C-terminal domain-containing protein [Candidatus Omnitrophota bacterium]